MNTFEITGMHTAFQAILKQSLSAMTATLLLFKFICEYAKAPPTAKLLHSSSKARQSHIAFYCVYRSVRVHIRTDGDFTREVDDDVQRIRVYFSTNPQIVNESNGFDLASVISDLNVAVDNFNRRGSGFVLESIKHFVICITQYRPLHGGSSYIPTPQWLKNKYCIINVENRADTKCFLWSILAHIHQPQRNKERLYNYKRYENSLNVDGLSFPMQTKEITLFEQQNPDISVNVLYYDTCSILCLPHFRR